MSAKQIPPADCSDPAERRRRIEAEPLPANVWRLFEDAAAEAPDRALWDFFESGEVTSYRSAVEQAIRLSDGLSSIGVRPGTRVALMLPNTGAYPLTWLALTRLAAVAVPANIRYTARELAYLLTDSGAEYVVVHSEQLPVVLEALEELRDFPRRHVLVVGAAPAALGSWQSLFDAAPDKRASHTPDRDELLSIQYTSGTTGMPKGCLLTHRHWLTCGKVNASRDGRVYRRILASTPFFYMDPHWLLLMTIYQRATLYVAARQSAARFMEWVRTHRIEFCLFPELALKQLPSPFDAENVLIRMNIYGVRRDSHAEIERRFNVMAREAYGMTELGSAMYMPMEAVDMVGSGSCGIPSPFRECRIVDENGRVLPPNEAGELQVRGPGMMLGYHNKPEANRAAFDGDWFRTGDLFRQDDRGYFYIVGRLKDMIRRSGENIAAREVEEVLRGLADVAEAAVVPVPDETRGEEVKAYLVLQPGRTALDLTPARVIEHCAHNLAPFKLPRYIEYVSELPKTPSGKISKALLPKSAYELRRGFDRVEGRWL